MAVTQRKTYEIVKSGRRDTLDVDGKTLRFNKRGVTTTDDPGIARAVRERYGYETKTGDGSAVVCELEAYNEHRDRRPGANAHYWSVPEMPWKTGRKEEQNG